VIDRAPWLPWLVAAVAYFAIAHLGTWIPDSPAGQYVAAHGLQGLFAFALLLPAVFGDPSRGWVRRLLANRVLLWVGLVSYGLYLWHAAIISKLSDIGARDSLGSFGFIAAALGLSLLVAAASFYLIERPALRLGRRDARRRPSHDADIRMHDLARHERPEPEAP
jgi:peptidoglycan/LPS O-acetylase OafA/YrhL